MRLTSIQEQLVSQGYVRIPGGLSPQQCQLALDSFGPSSSSFINNQGMTSFVSSVMLPQVKNHLQWSYINYTKYRVSDNNNSSDASCFHRDIIAVCPSSKTVKIVAADPIFTCLIYFDTTTMEVVPGSHRKHFMSHGTALFQLGSPSFSRKIKMEPGDVLVFYASLLHRGLFTERLPHRRLIQVFEVFAGPSAETLYAPAIVHVPASDWEEWKGIMMQHVSKLPFVIDYLNFIGYMNAATGYNVKANGCKSVSFYSSEASRPRSQYNDPRAPINTYVLNPNMQGRMQTLNEDEKKVFVNRSYTYPYSIYVIVTFLILSFVIGFVIHGREIVDLALKSVK